MVGSGRPVRVEDIVYWIVELLKEYVIEYRRRNIANVGILRSSRHLAKSPSVCAHF